MKINSIGGKAIQVQIDGEDYSIADILHKELLSVKHVKFAGVAPPHPLIKTLTIQIHSDGADENGLLKVAVANAKERLEEILEAAKKVFPDAVKPQNRSDKKGQSTREEPERPTADEETGRTSEAVPTSSEVEEQPVSR